MAKLTRRDAAHVAGVARATLHRASKAGACVLTLTAIAIPRHWGVEATRSRGAGDSTGGSAPGCHTACQGCATGQRSRSHTAAPRLATGA